MRVTGIADPREGSASEVNGRTSLVLHREVNHAATPQSCSFLGE